MYRSWFGSISSVKKLFQCKAGGEEEKMMCEREEVNMFLLTSVEWMKYVENTCDTALSFFIPFCIYSLISLHGV